MTQDQKLWGGRFSAITDASLQAIARLDRSHDRLVEHDLAGCRAHAGALSRSGLSTMGSSIMQQKRNPDIPEPTRGRAARLIEALTMMLPLLKGLTFA